MLCRRQWKLHPYLGLLPKSTLLGEVHRERLSSLQKPERRNLYSVLDQFIDQTLISWSTPRLAVLLRPTDLMTARNMSSFLTGKYCNLISELLHRVYKQRNLTYSLDYLVYFILILTITLFLVALLLYE